MVIIIFVCFRRGFVTFTKSESARRAISEMHSKNVGGINLHVQLARRQPQIEPINDATSSVVWSSIGKFQIVILYYLQFILFYYFFLLTINYWLFLYKIVNNYTKIIFSLTIHQIF